MVDIRFTVDVAEQLPAVRSPRLSTAHFARRVGPDRFRDPQSPMASKHPNTSTEPLEQVRHPGEHKRKVQTTT